MPREQSIKYEVGGRTHDDSVCTNNFWAKSLIFSPWINLIVKVSVHSTDFFTLFTPCPGNCELCPGGLTMGWASLSDGTVGMVCGRLHGFRIERGAGWVRRPQYARPYLKIFLWRTWGSLSSGCKMSCAAGSDWERGEICRSGNGPEIWSSSW